MARGFFLGVLVTVLAALAGGYYLVASGALPAGQEAKPLPLEKWAAKKSLRATIQREAGGLKSPLPTTDENLAAGSALYVAHCLVCHGGPDGAPSAIAKGFSPTAPQMAKHGVEDDPEGTIYWKIAHGIRFTGMPAFRPSLSEPEMWQLALFLKQMDHLPPAARESWATGRP